MPVLSLVRRGTVSHTVAAKDGRFGFSAAHIRDATDRRRPAERSNVVGSCARSVRHAPDPENQGIENYFGRRILLGAPVVVWEETMTTTQPKATKTSSTFTQSCAIARTIHAPPERIWSLLTNAEDFPRWNSTVSRLVGPIQLGQRLELQVPLTPDRVFRPRVTGFEAMKSMEWSDGMAPMFRGVRTFTLVPRGDRSTDFTMTEVFSGLMLPLFRRSLPDFGPAFETYAADLAREAERKA